MAEPQASDFIIVGGGTAGLALASRLSEIPEAQVTVLEAGDDLLRDPRVLTPPLWQTLLTTSANWAYKTVPQKGLCDRELICAQGRLLGGCSAINALVFSVNARSNIEAWEKLGYDGWDWANFEQNLRKVYGLTKPSSQTMDTLGLGYIANDHQNADSPLKLSWTDEPGDEWPRIWRDTFINMDFPMVGVPFKGDAHGVFFTAEVISKTEPLAGKFVPNGKRNQQKYPPSSLSDLSTAKEFCKDMTFGAYHFTSSCAMLPRDMGGIVDEKLRVHGSKNLRVCDASIMPLIPRANPQSTVYAIAEAANGFIRAAWY